MYHHEEAHLAAHGAARHGRDVALPFLDAMVPARTLLAKTACGREDPPLRASSRCTARPAARKIGLEKNMWSPAAVGRQLRPDAEQPERRSSRIATT